MREEGAVKKVHIQTFGCVFFGNKTPPSPLNRPWDLCFNVQHLRDPVGEGLDPQVQRSFLDQNAGEVEFFIAFVGFVLALVFRKFDEAAIAINCRMGWSRSVSLAEILAGYIRECGYEVEVVHLTHDRKPPEEPAC